MARYSPQLPMMQPMLFRSPILLTFGIGSIAGSSFRMVKHPIGQRRASMSAISGPPKWQVLALVSSATEVESACDRLGRVLRHHVGHWVDNGGPLIAGGKFLYPGTAASSGVIDSHIFVDDDRATNLFWKNDAIGLWPRPLARLLRGHPGLIAQFFENESDR